MKQLTIEASTLDLSPAGADEIREYAAAVEAAAKPISCNAHFTAPVRNFDAINKNLAQWAAQHPNVVAL